MKTRQNWGQEMDGYGKQYDTRNILFQRETGKKKIIQAQYNMIIIVFWRETGKTQDIQASKRHNTIWYGEIQIEKNESIREHQKQLSWSMSSQMLQNGIFEANLIYRCTRTLGLLKSGVACQIQRKYAFRWNTKVLGLTLMRSCGQWCMLPTGQRHLDNYLVMQWQWQFMHFLLSLSLVMHVWPTATHDGDLHTAIHTKYCLVHCTLNKV